jgi:hypothetical protein
MLKPEYQQLALSFDPHINPTHPDHLEFSVLIHSYTSL